MNWWNILWAEFLYRPVFNLLIVFLALFGGNLGIAIILLTLAIRFLLLKNSVAKLSKMLKQTIIPVKYFYGKCEYLFFNFFFFRWLNFS